MPVFPQFERMVWFHQQTKTGRRPNAANLAERFEISTKTAQRDIVCLRDRFLAPLEYDPRSKGYYYTDDLFELPCLPAGQQEILCLLMARRLLDHAAGGYISRELDGLRDKIFSIARIIGFSPETIDKAISATWSGYSPVHEQTFRMTAWALLNHRLLAFEYRSPQTTTITQRITEPHHLQHYMASWVLIAWCRCRKAWRKFFLARMSDLKNLDQSFDPRPDDQWRSLLENAYGLFQGKQTIPVTLRFSPFRARWVREQHWHPKQKMSGQPDGSLELTLPAADFREIKMKILQFGADCEVVKPETLRKEIQAEIRKMATTYNDMRPAKTSVRKTRNS